MKKRCFLYHIIAIVKGLTRQRAPKRQHSSVCTCILHLCSDPDQTGIFPCSALTQVNFSCSFSNKVRCIKEIECLVEKRDVVKEETETH